MEPLKPYGTRVVGTPHLGKKETPLLGRRKAADSSISRMGRAGRRLTFESLMPHG